MTSEHHTGACQYHPIIEIDGGRVLVAAAEDMARAHECRYMDIKVVNLRTELPPRYEKLGYTHAGTEPWPAGVPSKLPCHFLLMEKAL